MSDVDDLVTWLRLQLDAREREIQGLLALGEISPRLGRELLAEVEVERRILELHQPYQDGYRWVDPDTRVPSMKCSVCHDIPADVDYDNPPYSVVFPCPTVRLMALPHAGRPGYREEWRP